MSIKSTSKPTLVKVVIPIYRNLNDEETASLNNTMEILGQHSISFLLPESYKADHLLSKYPKAEAIRVSDKWLGTQCGIAGYNNKKASTVFFHHASISLYVILMHGFFVTNFHHGAN